MKPIEAEIRLRNNRLLKARQRLKLTQKELADVIGFSVQRISNLELLKEPPINKTTGYWSKPALALSDYFCEQPEFLFPAETYNLDGRPTVQRVELEAEDIPNVLLEQSLSQLPDPDDAVMSRETATLIKNVIRNSKSLTKREKFIVEMHYGIHGHNPHTIEEIVEELNHPRYRGVYYQSYPLTCSHTRQLLEKALKKLRHPSHSARLRECID